MDPREAVLPILIAGAAFFAATIVMRIGPEVIAFVVENWN